jgi:uncharacterized protein YukE
MPFTQVLTRRARIIIPPEAHDIGRQLRSLVRETRDVAREAGSLLRGLDSSWQGRARDRFFQTFTSLPSRTDGAASLTDRLAGQVESITVTVWDTAWETIWQADPPSNNN